MNDKFEEEVNLMDYVKVLLKRKWLIMACFLVFLLVAGFMIFITPKVYKIETVLEVGRIQMRAEESSEQLIESPIQLLGKIEGDVYGIKVRQNLNITEQRWPEIKVDNPKDTNILVISIESTDTEQAKQILMEENDLIITDHQKIIETKKELLEKEAEGIEEKVKTIQEDIKITLDKIIPLENDILRIEAKILILEEEKENLESKVSALQEQLVFEQTPGTQFALFDAKERLADKKQETEDLYLRINSLRSSIENYNSEINSLERTITDYNFQINSLRVNIEEIRPTEIVKRSTISENPVEPRPLLYMAIAGILGIFIGIFWAFGKEWWETSK
jgi:capsular polysaccharide biosynthesis protein